MFKEKYMPSESFELLISYPDGHVEIIEETFATLEKAKQYGENMLNQISVTEKFHKNGDDILAPRLQKPHYEVYRKSEGKRELVLKKKGEKI